MAEFNCSDCMCMNHKILLFLRALVWLVCSGSGFAQIAGFTVFNQLPGVYLKVMSTFFVLTVPDVTKILSFGHIMIVSLFISHTKALLYAFRIHVQRFNRNYNVKKIASR
jgi:hypothetical protein